MIKRKLIFVLCLLSASTLFAKEYSFEQAYDRALQTSDTLSSAKREQEMYRAQLSSARGLYLPQIGVKGSYTAINDPISIDLNEIRSAIQPLYPAGVTLPPFMLKVQDEQFFQAQAYAAWTLYSGGKISSANKAAGANVEGAQAKLDMLSNNLLVELTNKYFGALLSDKMVEVREKFLQNARQNAKDGADMFRVGMIAKVEKMSVDVLLAQAERDYASSLNDAQMAQSLLKSLLRENEDIKLGSSLFVVATEKLPTLRALQDKALENNPSLALLDSKTVLSEANAKAQKSGFLPSVYLFANRELYTNDLTVLDPDYAYGVGFAWNLFEGGRTYNQTKAAEKQTQSIISLKQQQTKDILTGLEYYYKKMQNAEQNYRALQKELAFTEEFYKTRRLGFRTGTSTSLEVNMAMTQWLKTQLDSLKAQYDFVTSLAMLLSLSGQADLFGEYAKQAL